MTFIWVKCIWKHLCIKHHRAKHPFWRTFSRCNNEKAKQWPNIERKLKRKNAMRCLQLKKYQYTIHAYLLKLQTIHSRIEIEFNASLFQTGTPFHRHKASYLISASSNTCYVSQPCFCSIYLEATPANYSFMSKLFQINILLQREVSLMTMIQSAIIWKIF